MFDVEVANVLDVKVVNDKVEHYGSPFVTPEARHGGCFEVAFVAEEFAEDIVVYFTHLG